MSLAVPVPVVCVRGVRVGVDLRLVSVWMGMHPGLSLVVVMGMVPIVVRVSVVVSLLGVLVLVLVALRKVQGDAHDEKHRGCGRRVACGTLAER